MAGVAGVPEGEVPRRICREVLGACRARTSANSRELTAPGGTQIGPDGHENTSDNSPGTVSSRLFRPREKTCLWLHAVSVGEVNLLVPLLKMIEQGRPEWQCVISTTTDTGMAVAKKKYPKIRCSTARWTSLGREVGHAAHPAGRVVLAELELWPNLIRAAKRHGAKVAVINGRLGEKSFRGYRRIRPLVAGLLRQIDLLAVQDETYAERFRGARCAAGNGSCDRLDEIRRRSDRSRQSHHAALAALAGFSDDDIVLWPAARKSRKRRWCWRHSAS